MRQTYIFDTSVLIDNPFAYEDKNFENSNVIIPIVVFSELDNLKKQPHEKGRNARVCIKALEQVSLQGDINIGINIDNGVILKVDTTYYTENDCCKYGDYKYGDTQILCSLITCWQNNRETTLVSNDINLRLKARAQGVAAISHISENKFYNELYAGCKIIDNMDASNDLEDNLEIDDDLYNFNLLPNECVIFENKDDPDSKPVLGRKIEDKIKLVNKTYPWGITPRNSEQFLACDVILDPNIDLITMSGKAGCGKSLISFACALENVVNVRNFNKIIIYRPIQPCGADVGYLPGELNDKLMTGWFQASLDTFEYLFSNKSVGPSTSSWRATFEFLQKKNLIEFGALTYIRGRSFPKTFLIIDEAQNISKEDIKTILTRIGDYSKVLLLGDIDQIDNPELDFNENGLTYVIEKFKNCKFAAHITFTKGERSRLATLASSIL